jgi:LPXTG-motif cell wall-anchored protein
VREIRAAAIVAFLLSGLVPAGAGADEIGAAAPVAEPEAEVAEAVLTPASEPAPEPARKGAAISATRTVTIGDNFYDPDALTIGLGDTVTWINSGTVPEGHTVTGSAFDSGVIEEGGSFSQRFASAGVFDYICELHDDMTGTVVVRGPASGSGDPDPGDGGGGGAGTSGDGGGGGGGETGGGGAGSGDGDGGGGASVSESDAVAGDDAAGSNSSLPATGADLLPPALVGLMLLCAGLLLRRRTSA